jgi:PKD repeat protein
MSAMKKIYSKLKILSTVFLLSLIGVSCTENDFPVPTASTQADFDFSFDKFLNEQTGKINYKVIFENKSLHATGYFWDFNNGQTSTQENPEVIYSDGGVYMVTLKVTPENELYYNKLEATQRMVLVPTIFREQFSDPKLKDNFPPEGWLLRDADGDGNNWYWGTSQGESYILSDSWISATNEALTPDNWIITPQIDLTTAAGAMLEYEVTPRATNPAFKVENYSILVSETGTQPSDFQSVYTERLPSTLVNWDWARRNVKISQYAGKKIYIAIRHHDSTDLWSIVMRDIHVYETAD